MSPLPEPDPRPDEELIAACNRGESDAFEAIYLRYRDWVARIALRFTGNDDDALDVLQDVFEYLLRKFPGFRLTARLTTFLYPAVKHLAIAARRRTMRSLPFDEEVAELKRASSGAGHTEDIAVVVGALPEEQREILIMRFVDGLSLAEIGDALDLPLGTVKSRIHRGIEALREDPRARRYFEP